MKNKRKYSIPLMLLFLFANSANGQSGFMRDVLNAVKGTAQGRANNTATQETNKAIDQVDPAKQSKSHSGNTTATQSDTANTQGVLEAFAKAAAANPNDTSAADLTMKALGIMAGEKQVSAQDSATAIKTYMSAARGSGLHFEYAITMSGNKTSVKDSTEIYFTNSGEGRSEMRIPMPGLRLNKMISIGRQREPGYTIILYPESRTYILHIIDTSLMIKSEESYQVTRIGTETIQGYPCVHSKIVTTSGSGRFKYSSSMEVWTSTAVPGYALYKKMTSLQTTQTGMISALETAGGGGVFVKLVVSGTEYSMEQLLIKAEEKSLPASLFLIPADYSESKYNSIYHMIPSSGH